METSASEAKRPGGGGGGIYPPPTVGTFPKIMSTKIVSTKKAVENEILGI